MASKYSLLTINTFFIMSLTLTGGWQNQLVISQDREGDKDQH